MVDAYIHSASYKHFNNAKNIANIIIIVVILQYEAVCTTSPSFGKTDDSPHQLLKRLNTLELRETSQAVGVLKG